MNRITTHLIVLSMCGCLFTTLDSHAQKVVLIEKTGFIRSERIHLYEELTFTLKGDDKLWYKRQLLDIDVNGQLLLLGDTWTAISDIGRLHLKRQRSWANLIGGALMGGGGSMILGDLYYTIVKDQPEVTEDGMEFGVVNIAAGAGMRAAFAPIKYRLGGRKRLRAVDLTF